MLRSFHCHCCHTVVGHWKQWRHKIDDECYVKQSEWGSYPLLSPRNPSYDPKSSYPAQVFSRLLDDQGISEFIFTDFFQTSSRPLTNKQAARACVALTSFVCPRSAHPRERTICSLWMNLCNINCLSKYLWAKEIFLPKMNSRVSLYIRCQDGCSTVWKWEISIRTRSPPKRL